MSNVQRTAPETASDFPACNTRSPLNEISPSQPTTEAQPIVSAVMHSEKRRPFGLISLGVVSGLAAWSAFSLRADLARLSLVHVHSLNTLLIVMTLSLLNYVLRIIRWRFYLRQLGHSLTLGFCALTYVAGFALTLSPGKFGEMVRARYYMALGIPLTKIVGAFFVERLLDVVAMSLLAAPMWITVPRYQNVIWAAAALVLCIMVPLTVLPWDIMARRIDSLSGLPNILKRFNSGAASGLASAHPLLGLRTVIWSLVLGLVAWGLEGVGLRVLGSLFASGHLDTFVAIGIYAIAVLVGALSFVPGGLGGTEAVMTTLLRTQGYSLAESLMLALACRLATLWFAVGLGWMAVLALRVRMNRGAVLS